MRLIKRRAGVCFVLALLLFLSACSAAYPFEKGYEASKLAKPDKALTLGDLNKAGWALSIPKDAFKEETELELIVLSEEEGMAYQDGDFTFLGTPIRVGVKDELNVRLEKPLTLTMKFPNDQLEGLLHEELFFGYYADGRWEYTIPDAIDLNKGTAQFTLYHFSDYGFGRPSEATQLENYAKNMATNVWKNENEKNAYILATSQQFNDLFDAMGVESRTARNQLLADIVSFVDESDVGYFDYMAQSANAIAKGNDGKLDFENKWKEFVGKSLYSSLNKDPSGFAGKANIFGNLASAAGSIAGGDSKAALKSIANMLNGAVPLSQLVASTSAYMAAKANQAIDYWAASEIEKAYQVYATGVGGKYGYEDGLKGDFDTIFILLGGGQRQFEIRIIEQYCKKQKDEDCNLSDAKKQEIINNAKTALKDSFDKRMIAEPAINRIKNDELGFIQTLKAEHLLNASSYAKYFGIEKNGDNYNVQDRLDRLYRIRETVLSLMDENTRKTITDEFLAKAINQWIYWNERGDREGFMQYLRDMGYLKEPLVINPKLDGYWQLTGTNVLNANFNENRGGSVASGSATFTGVAPNVGDSFSASMTWNAPGSKYHAGDPIEIQLNASITGYVWNGKNDGYLHMGLNYMNAQISARIDMPGIAHGYGTGGSISFKNEDGDYLASVKTDYGKIAVNQMTLDTKASFSAGSKAGDKRSIYVSTTGGSVEYVYTWNE